MEDIFAKLYDMTAFSNIIADPSFLIMYAIAFILLYLGIRKHYEPLLLVHCFRCAHCQFPRWRHGGLSRQMKTAW